MDRGTTSGHVATLGDTGGPWWDTRWLTQTAFEVAAPPHPPGRVHKYPGRPHPRHSNPVAPATMSSNDTIGDQILKPSKVTKGQSSTSRATYGGNSVADTVEDGGSTPHCS